MIHSINNFQLNKLSLLPKNIGPCADNYIGKIKFNGNDFEGIISTNKNEFALIRNNSNKKKNVQPRREIDYKNFSKGSNKSIVVLLESPHIKEYSFNNKIRINGPAMGRSGTIFNNNCINVFNSNINVLSQALSLISGQAEDIDVYFVNAIQYQCSLGCPEFDRNIRDFIFEALWNTSPYSFKDDLIDRLNIIKPDLIINACTKELREHCCNGNAISHGLNYNGYTFLAANNHINKWNNAVLII